MQSGHQSQGQRSAYVAKVRAPRALLGCRRELLHATVLYLRTKDTFFHAHSTPWSLGCSAPVCSPLTGKGLSQARVQADACRHSSTRNGPTSLCSPKHTPKMKSSHLFGSIGQKEEGVGDMHHGMLGAAANYARPLFSRTVPSTASFARR